MRNRTLITEIMNGYFEDQPATPINFLAGVSISSEIPIVPSSITWEKVTDPTRLMKTYEFDSHSEMVYFVQEMLMFENDFDHYAKMSIDFPKVVIEVYTHDVNNITELDTDYAKSADQIRKDVSDYVSEEIETGEHYDY